MLALGAEPLGPAGLAVPAAADRRVAFGVAAEALVLRDARVLEQDLGRFLDLRGRQLDPPARASAGPRDTRRPGRAGGAAPARTGARARPGLAGCRGGRT